MKGKVTVISVLLVLACFSYSGVNADKGFMIIVHDSNPATQLPREEIAKIFLKKSKQWQMDNSTVHVVDLVQDSAVREIFSEIILNRKIPAVKAYWQKQIFSGRNVPPPEFKSEKEILAYIHENKGAIGYVSRNTSLEGYNVKELTINAE